MTRRRLVRAAVIVVISVVVGWAVLELGRRIDWPAVGDALGKLVWWQALVLLVLLVARLVVNATPVARFVPDLTRPQAVQNDLTANLVATITPPPADVVIRIAMFRSWKVDPVDGMAGVVLTSFVFYAARLFAPVLGFLLLAGIGFEERQWALAAVSGTLAVTILVVLVLVMRSRHWAVFVGRSAARIARRVRPTVDEESWISAVVSFRERVADTLNRHLLPALLGLMAGIVIESVIVLASLRFVGVSSTTLGTVEILAAFLTLFPLTMLPMFGLGVLDAIMISGWVAIAGESQESVLLAGALVWRTVTLGGTLLLGALSTWWWRHSVRDSQEPSTSPSGSGTG